MGMPGTAASLPAPLPAPHPTPHGSVLRIDDGTGVLELQLFQNAAESIALRECVRTHDRNVGGVCRLKQGRCHRGRDAAPLLAREGRIGDVDRGRVVRAEREVVSHREYR